MLVVRGTSTGVYGITKNDLKNGNHHNKNLQEAHDQDPNFTVIVHETSSREVAFDIEQKMLDDNYLSGNLFNVSKDVFFPNKGLAQSDYQKQRAREANTGKHVTEETRQRMSAIHKGKKLSPEHNAAFQEANARSKEKEVVIEGIEYPSMKDAAISLGIHRSTAVSRILSGSEKFKEWKFKE